MPDKQGNATDQDLLVALGWENEPEVLGIPTEPGPITPAAPVAPVDATPVAPVAPQAPVAPIPGMADQQAAIRQQQVELYVQQEQNKYQQQLISQNINPQVAALTAQQAGARYMAEFRVSEMQNQVGETNKNALVAELSREKGIDPTLLQGYNDPVTMRAAADQYGRMNAIEKTQAAATATPKAPVQQFADGNATAGASNLNAQIGYMTGQGPAQTAQEFEKMFGFNPLG